MTWIDPADQRNERSARPSRSPSRKEHSVPRIDLGTDHKRLARVSCSLWQTCKNSKKHIKRVREPVKSSHDGDRGRQ